MSDEPPISIRLDDRLEDYRSFFDHAWAEKIGQLASGTTVFDPVFILTANWRAAANTCSMPWLLVHSLRSEWSGFLQSQQPLSQRIAKGLADRLSGKAGEAELSRAEDSWLNPRRRPVVRQANCRLLSRFPAGASGTPREERSSPRRRSGDRAVEGIPAWPRHRERRDPDFGERYPEPV